MCSDRYANLDDLAIGQPIGQPGAIYSSVDRTTNFSQTVVSATDSPLLLNSSTEPPINACSRAMVSDACSINLLLSRTTNKCMQPDYNKLRVQYKSIAELCNRTTNDCIQDKRKETNIYVCVKVASLDF